jgi:hypothetical protein
MSINAKKMPIGEQAAKDRVISVNPCGKPLKKGRQLRIRNKYLSQHVQTSTSLEKR